MSDANKLLSRRSFQEIWNERNLAVVDELYAVDYRGHITARAEVIQGPAALKQFAVMFQFAFPDIRFTIEDQIAEGSRVASRWVVSGSQQGEFLGIAPNGDAITLAGISIQHIDAGKITESWDNWDALSILQRTTGDIF
ncbi:MAG: ester cyclase, partial [Candidatus Competibacteraceae bacterium]|nr:ester cyclase [Candidatus Competibacteraceae bacterium]